MLCANLPTVDNGTPVFSLKSKPGNSESSSARAEVVSRPAVSAISLRPEDYIAFQMSFLGRDIRGVFVDYEQGTYYVTVFVDKRDLELNRRVFEQERAIMHFYRQYRFDLSIIPLENRSMADIAISKGQKVL
jgi:hypothetical protein